MLCCLAPYCKNHRVKIFNDILPSWDANQTWLVFTIAGVYGAFPIYFGQLMSKYYSFFFLMLILFIVRGAAIEFYIKSYRLRSFWLQILSLSSGLLILSQVFLCTILLGANPKVFIALLPFILWFHYTQACNYLFTIKHRNRIIYVLGIMLTSHFLFELQHVMIWGGLFTSSIFLIRMLLLLGFLSKPMPQVLGKILMYYVFFSNTLLVLASGPGTKIFTIKQAMHSNTYSAFFIINVFSLALLPMIGIGLAVMKRIFLTTRDEIVY
jgi:cytochrome bd-type quinol oxidase subunit 2